MNFKNFLKLFFVTSFLISANAIADQVNYLLPMTSKQINAESAQNYKEALKSGTVLNNKEAALVKKVGKRIASAIDKYYALNPEKKRPQESFNWEFNLLKNNTPNAWCMPGGKVAVYTGILPYTKDETGLAVVMSHEIAHAVAEHGKKQSNTNVVKNIGGLIVKNAKGDAAKKVYDYGSGLATLKYSRTHETQADKLGLVFMKLAGYEPKGAIAFWERMAAGGSGSSTPQFLSTHPSDDTRIKNIVKFLESKEYKESIK
jgi:predicted Zn-dependent protease